MKERKKERRNSGEVTTVIVQGRSEMNGRRKKPDKELKQRWVSGLKRNN